MRSSAESPEEWLMREVAKLRDARAAHPGRSILFPDLGDAATRRQIVRWIASEYDAPTPGILEVLRTALDDTDWEVRASAIIVAARLHCTTLRAPVREAALPYSGQFGLDDTDIQLLTAMRFIASTLLGAAADAAEAAATVALDFPMLHHGLGALVRRDAGHPTTRLQLLLHALVTPTPLRDELPQALPHGIEVRNERAFIAGTDIAMVWLAPAPFILGGDAPPDSQTATVRSWVLPSGIFISRRPLRATDVSQCGLPVPSGDPVDPALALRLRLMPDPPLVMDHATASALCGAMSHQLHSTITLPEADELECVARSSDGRRFAWGNGMQRLTGDECSPSGLEWFAAPAAQWTETRDASGTPLTLGGPASPSCATRGSAGSCAALRVVIREIV